MKYLKYFEDYNSGTQCQNREECIAKYGKSLFGKKISWFSWLPWAEENNEIENLIIKSITDFTNMDHGKRLSPELVNKLKELSKCISVYPSVLKPSENPIYRGTGISLRELLKYDISDDLTIPKYIYKPNSPIDTGSPATLLQHFLELEGSRVVLYDPWVLPESRLPETPHFFILGVRHKVFKDIVLPEGSVMFDPWGFYDSQKFPYQLEQFGRR